jgi:hypothetical protein
LLSRRSPATCPRAAPPASILWWPYVMNDSSDTEFSSPGRDDSRSNLAPSPICLPPWPHSTDVHRMLTAVREPRLLF